MIFGTPEIDIPVAQSTAVSSVHAALDAAEVIGYPVILRSAFTLGGLGSGFANNPDELRDLSARSLSLSPQVLIERSMKGWKELEYEVVRDGADVCPFAVMPKHYFLTYYHYRILLFAAIWRISIRSVHIPVTPLSLHLRRHCPTMSTICFVVLHSRSSDILALLVNVTSNMPLTRIPENTVSSK